MVVNQEYMCVKNIRPSISLRLDGWNKTVCILSGVTYTCFRRNYKSKLPIWYT